MAPDSVSTQVVAAVAAVALAILAAAGWDRLPGGTRPRGGTPPWGWARWPLRILPIVLSFVLVAAAGLIGLNRQMEFFPTWGQLFGQAPTGPAGPGAADPAHAGSSRIVSFTVAGAVSGLHLRAYAYLPPGYDTSASVHTRYPAIVALHGYPGTPQSWLRGLNAQRRLDQEITAGRMAPTVVVFPLQDPHPTRDSQCVNAVGGAQVDTYLTTDLPAVVARLFRVRTDRAAWGLIGYSAGGFCAVNLGLRHPDRFAAVASLSGYFHALTSRASGDLYLGDANARDLNTPLWRLRRLPIPALAVWAGCARDERYEYDELQQLAAAARAPLRLTTAVVARGGHSQATWGALEGPAWDWLSSWLAGPQEASS